MAWTQPMCESCWIDREGVWVTDAITGKESLSAVRIPIMAKERELLQCAFCGKPTFVGIFTRADPDSVPYPRKEPDGNDTQGPE